MIDEDGQPVDGRDVVYRAAGDVVGARLGARHFQTMGAEHQPAIHHGVGDLGVKLQRVAGAVAEGLDRERIAPRPTIRRPSAGRSLRGAIDRRGPATPSTKRARPRSAGSDNSRTRPALPDADRHGRRDAAPSSAHRGRCRDTASCRAAAHRSSRSRGEMKSSLSLALCGPPKITAPACSSIVLRSGSPKRGRRMSSDSLTFAASDRRVRATNVPDGERSEPASTWRFGRRRHDTSSSCFAFVCNMTAVQSAMCASRTCACFAANPQASTAGGAAGCGWPR